jgi:ribonuclease D
MNLPQPIFVSTPAALDECVAACSAVRAIAVDTEFMRTDTFYPILGLIQISDGQSVWLIDPLAVEDFTGLDRLFSDPAITKVFHSCSEDLEVLRHQLGIVPTPLFDTQVAAAFLGYGFSRGYSALVQDVLNVELEKHETRSDWLKRPLSASQLNYAAEDVFYLSKVYDAVESALKENARMEWIKSDMEALVATTRLPEELDDYYLRVKGAWRLSPTQLAKLQSLSRWREQEARNLNRPRNRVLSDKVLLDIVTLCPADVNRLKQVPGIHIGQVKRFGAKILSLLEETDASVSLESLPEPLSRQQRQQLSEARAVIDELAKNLAVAPEVLVRKKDLEHLIVHGRLPDSITESWRGGLIGNMLDGIWGSQPQ